MTNAPSRSRLGAILTGAALPCGGGALVIGGAALAWSDRVARTGDLFTSDPRHYDIAASALVSEHVDLPDLRPGWLGPDSMLGTVRVEVAAGDGRPMFVGVAPTGEVGRYLDDVAVAHVDDLAGLDHPTVQPGARVPSSPSAAGIWSASTTGPTPRALTWDTGAGDWSVVIMRPDGSAGFDVTIRAGAEIPALPWIAASTAAAGLFVVAGGMALFVTSLRREPRTAAALVI